MRATFARLLPAVPVLGGRGGDPARRLGAGGGSGDGLPLVRRPHRLAELHRVLSPRRAPGPGLAGAGRERGLGGPAGALVDGYKRGDPPRYAGGTWRRVFEAPPPGVRFTPLQAASFPFAHSAPRETILQRVASTSFFVGALSEDERQEVLRRARDLLDCHPQTQGRQTIDLPYTADLYWCTRTTA